MKIKILIASYTDWAIVAVLGVFLCVAAAKSFVIKDNKLDDLKAEIDGYEKKIKQRITSADILPMPKTDYVAALRDRFEHMPVISPYQRNPFLPPREILYPLTQLKQGAASRPIKLPGVRLVEKVQLVEEAKADFTYNADEDYSSLVITAVHPGECTLRIRDDLEQVYRFPVRIRPVPQLPNPLPPINVVVASRGPYDVPKQGHTYEHKPAAVLIFFQPDNPSPMPMNVGTTTAAVIYRKPADSPDTIWQRLHKAEFILPASPEQAKAMLDQFNADKLVRPAASGPARPAPRPTGPVVAEAAPEAPVTPAAGPAEAAGAILAIPPNSFVYLDEEIEPGESYLYRIDTYSTDPDATPAVCRDPYIHPTAISVRSLVQMTLVSATPRSARIRLSRTDPETRELYEDEINVAAGMKIGGKLKKKVAAGVDGRGAPQVKDVTVDYSTDCIMVGVETKVREIAYKVPLALDKAGRPLFKVVKVEEPRIYYLTPHGYLRMKSKDETPATTPGGVPAPGAPGAPPVPGAFGRP